MRAEGHEANGPAASTWAAFCLPACTLQVVVSLKRLEDDPLKETLDKVLPLNDNRVSAGFSWFSEAMPLFLELCFLLQWGGEGEGVLDKHPLRPLAPPAAT